MTRSGGQVLVDQLLIGFEDRERIDSIFRRDIAHGGQRVPFAERALVFHAGTARQGERLVTNGGRVLAVTATGVDVGAARAAAYEAADRISFAGMRLRRDIALAAAEGHVRS